MPRSTPTAESRLEELAPTGPDVTRRRMFGQATVFVNGNMFLGTFGGQVFVRLSEPDRAAAAVELGATLFEPVPGRPMREYVVLPEAVLKDRARVSAWVQRGAAYTRGLPAKGARRPRNKRERP